MHLTLKRLDKHSVMRRSKTNQFELDLNGEVGLVPGSIMNKGINSTICEQL